MVDYCRIGPFCHQHSSKLSAPQNSTKSEPAQGTGWGKYRWEGVHVCLSQDGCTILRTARSNIWIGCLFRACSGGQRNERRAGHLGCKRYRDLGARRARSYSPRALRGFCVFPRMHGLRRFLSLGNTAVTQLRRLGSRCGRYVLDALFFGLSISLLSLSLAACGSWLRCRRKTNQTARKPLGQPPARRLR